MQPNSVTRMASCLIRPHDGRPPHVQKNGQPMAARSHAMATLLFRGIAQIWRQPAFRLGQRHPLAPRVIFDLILL